LLLTQVPRDKFRKGLVKIANLITVLPCITCVSSEALSLLDESHSSCASIPRCHSAQMLNPDSSGAEHEPREAARHVRLGLAANVPQTPCASALAKLRCTKLPAVDFSTFSLVPPALFKTSPRSAPGASMLHQRSRFHVHENVAGAACQKSQPKRRENALRPGKMRKNGPENAQPGKCKKP
jgi:hypothetical protein